MLYRRFENYQRTHFIITNDEIENISKYDSFEMLLNFLTDKYNSRDLDYPPYHYIVMNGVSHKIKETTLAHNDSSFMYPFNNDIRILFIGNNNEILSNTDIIAEIIGKEAANYSMRISDRILVTDLCDFNESKN